MSAFTAASDGGGGDITAGWDRSQLLRPTDASLRREIPYGGDLGRIKSAHDFKGEKTQQVGAGEETWALAEGENSFTSTLWIQDFNWI